MFDYLEKNYCNPSDLANHAKSIRTQIEELQHRLNNFRHIIDTQVSSEESRKIINEHYANVLSARRVLYNMVYELETNVTDTNVYRVVVDVTSSVVVNVTAKTEDEATDHAYEYVRNNFDVGFRDDCQDADVTDLCINYVELTDGDPDTEIV